MMFGRWGVLNASQLDDICNFRWIWGDITWSYGEGNGNQLQYCCLENPMSRGAWWAAVTMGSRRVGTWLSDFTFTFHFHALEREMAAHSCSCLENPRPSGAWWTAVHGVAQSPIRLKRLSSSSNLILSWRSIWDSDCVTTLYLGRPVGDTGTVKFLYVLKVLRQWLDLRSWY